MQKNERSFSFLFSFSTRNHIRIRRFEVSRRVIQTGTIAAFFITTLSFLVIGITGLVRQTTLARSFNNNTLLSQITAAGTDVPAAFDYSRPASSSDVAVNSGGPASTDGDVAIEDAVVESKLLALEKTTDPANLPTIWAHLGKINNEFGFRRNPFGGRIYEFHAGMDIDGERGDLVIAPAGGLVTKAGWQGGYGQMIEVDHGNGLTTRYGHLSKLNVVIGDSVFRGQLIGFIGSSGRSTGPHLHYELRLNDHPINPRRFLPPEPTDIAKRN
jgi:murein DD-endopeptidase MepM/ murein hydrolase activator NlpD